jgi:hypothetical protein
MIGSTLVRIELKRIGGIFVELAFHDDSSLAITRVVLDVNDVAELKDILERDLTHRYHDHLIKEGERIEREIIGEGL